MFEGFREKLGIRILPNRDRNRAFLLSTLCEEAANGDCRVEIIVNGPNSQTSVIVGGVTFISPDGSSTPENIIIEGLNELRLHKGRNYPLTRIVK